MVIVALLTAGGAATFGKMAEADQTFLIPAAACGLVYLIILWIESRKLARSFGKGFIYGLLLFFFGRFFRVLLGLSAAEYRGKH